MIAPAIKAALLKDPSGPLHCEGSKGFGATKYADSWEGSASAQCVPAQIGLAEKERSIEKMCHCELVEAKETIFHFPQAENCTCFFASPLPTKPTLCGDPCKPDVAISLGEAISKRDSHASVRYLSE